MMRTSEKEKKMEINYFITFVYSQFALCVRERIHSFCVYENSSTKRIAKMREREAKKIAEIYRTNWPDFAQPTDTFELAPAQQYYI